MKKKSTDCLYIARAVLSGPDEAIVDGAVRARKGIIEAIGRRKDFPAKPDYPVCDLGGAVLARKRALRRNSEEARLAC